MPPSDRSVWFDLAPVALVVLDHELRVVGANDHYLRLTGSDPASLIGRHFLAAFPNDPNDPNDGSRRMLEASLNKVLRTRETDYLAHIPYRVARAPGAEPELRVWSATHVPVLDGEGRVRQILQHTQDVTELDHRSALDVLARAETVQRDAHAKDRALRDLHAVVEQAPGFWAFLTGPDHVFSLVNEAYTRLVGGRHVLGKPVREALPDVVGQGYPELLDRVYRKGETYVGQGHRVDLLDERGLMVSRLVDFIYQPIRGDHGDVVGILVQGHDRTEQAWTLERDRFRARVAQYLARAHEDPEAALIATAREAARTIADWAVIDLFDGPESRRLVAAHANPADAPLARALVAYPLPSEIPAAHVLHGQSNAPRVVTDVTPELLRAMARSAEHAALIDEMGTRSVLSVPLWHRERLHGLLVLLNGADRRRFTEADVAPFAELGSLLATALDNARLTQDRERALREAHEAQSRAERASRAKDDFLAMLGHELRNPLAPILSAVELMRLRSDGANGREREIIERQARHLTRLVDDMLDTSAIVHGKLHLHRAPISIALVAEKAVEIASALIAEHEHTLEVAVDETLVVDGDEARLAQIIANLLTNAARYTPPRGRLWLTAAREGTRAKITVRDQGKGIAPELLPMVFEMFVQAPQSSDRPSGGLGLGLTLVRRLVELHDGTVELTSEGLGRGTTATVMLPLHDEVADAQPTRAAPAAAVTGRRVLIVDDNADAAELLAELLGALGHDTLVAGDGHRALEVLGEQASRIDVAVVDLGLPGMDGLELARVARARLGSSTPRLIALTGYGSAEDRAQTLEAGFAAHLTKPVNAAQLLRAIDEP